MNPKLFKKSGKLKLVFKKGEKFPPLKMKQKKCFNIFLKCEICEMSWKSEIEKAKQERKITL